MIKSFLKSPAGLMLSLFFFASNLIDRTKDIGRVLTISTSSMPGYSSGYYTGYKFGSVTGIVMHSILVAFLLFKLYNHLNNKKVAGF